MLGSYRALFRIAGTRSFCAAALLARLPGSMLVLSIVLLVSKTTGSFAAAGAMTAAFQVTTSTVPIVSSRLIDRYGQARVLPPLILAQSALLVAFTVAVTAHVPLLACGVVIAVAGAFGVPFGSAVRARWSHVAPADQVPTAYAMESTLDEVNWTIGPLLTAFLATAFGAGVPLVVAAILSTLGGIWFAMLRNTQPPVRTGGVVHRGRDLVHSPLPVVVLILIAIGVLFGAFELTLVSFADAHHAHGASGYLLALWAVGSMAGGLWFGSRRWQSPLSTQVLILLAVLLLATVPPLLIHTVQIMGLGTFIAGVAVAPTLIVCFTLAERSAPASAITESITWAMSGITAGFALGTAITGVLLDHWGSTAGFIMTIAGALTAMAIAGATQTILRTAAFPQSPTDMGKDYPSTDPLPGISLSAFEAIEGQSGQGRSTNMP